jgi:prepilin-type N-terminal cleavage/methylation domain-containing protein
MPITYKRSKMSNSNEKGFSLLEVSLAVGIIAILTMIAIPTFSGMIPTVETKVSERIERDCEISNELDALASAVNGVSPSLTPCVS